MDNKPKGDDEGRRRERYRALYIDGRANPTHVLASVYQNAARFYSIMVITLQNHDQMFSL